MTSADDLLNLLGSDLNRRILALTSEEERSADAIAERCEASLPTVYRHIDDLRSAGLLTDRTEYDAAGNHFKRYGARLSTLTVTIADGDLQVSVGTPAPREDAGLSPDVESVD